MENIFLFCKYKIKLYLCSVIKDPLCPYGHLPLYGENLQSAVDIKGADTKANTKCNDSMAFPVVILNSFQDMWADKDKKRLSVKHKWRLSVRCWNKFSMTPSITSSWTCLTSFNLLTLGIAHASMALLSLNRKFQDLWADKDKWRLAVRCWNKFSMTPTIPSSWTCLTSFNLLTLGIAHASMTLLSLNRKFQDLWAD